MSKLGHVFSNVRGVIFSTEIKYYFNNAGSKLGLDRLDKFRIWVRLKSVRIENVIVF